MDEIPMDEHSRLLRKMERYPLLGKGMLGRVYKYNRRICIKVNKYPDINQKEVELFRKFNNCPLFPKFYGSGKYYIVMQLIPGVSLESYLVNGGTLTNEILENLLDMFHEGIKAGLKLNPNARHIFLPPQSKIKLVDIEDIIKLSAEKPTMLFNQLYKCGQNEIFKEFVKGNHELLYKQWYELSNPNGSFGNTRI